MSAREIRAHLCEVRAAPEAEGKLRFSGYAAVFDSWSEDLGGFRERIAKGAFAEAVGRDDVRALLNHDPNHVLGRSKSGTLTLTEDEKGLHFDVDAPDTGWTRDLRQSVLRGDIDQCSFSFVAEDEEWRYAERRGEIDERTLKKVKLLDVSIVTYPAYPATEASARSIHEAARKAHDREMRDTHNNDIKRRRLALIERMSNHE